MSGVASVAEERNQQLAIMLDDIELAMKDYPQALAQSFGLRNFKLDPFAMLLLYIIVVGRNNRLFGRKVIVRGPQRHSRPLGDVAHGGCIESALTEKVEGRGKNLLARGFTFFANR